MNIKVAILVLVEVLITQGILCERYRWESVAILVLVEVLITQYDYPIYIIDRDVAILVLVEVLITRKRYFQRVKNSDCRNPCFSGSSNHTQDEDGDERIEYKSQSLF